MSQAAPYEVIAQPFTLYVAPVGTSFPKVDASPSGSWVKVGTSGPLNYAEDGVTITHDQKVDTWKSLGSTGARKAFRTEESLTVALKLVDITLEQYSYVMNGNTVTSTPAGVGTPGSKKIGMSRGLSVKQYALLVRGDNSPYGIGNMQLEIPVAIESSKPKPKFAKGKPAELDLEFDALEDPSAGSDDERFGRLVAQTAEATT